MDNVPWVEKYRPHILSDMLDQNQILTPLINCVANNLTLPHCLFYGPPGIGKTTAALALSKQLFGPAFIRERVIELNASVDSAINSAPQLKGF